MTTSRLTVLYCNSLGGGNTPVYLVIKKMSFIKRFKTWYYRTKLRFTNLSLNLCKPMANGCIIQVTGDIALTDLMFSIYSGRFHQHVHSRYVTVDASDRYLALGCQASVILHKPKVRTVMINGVTTNCITFIMYITDRYGCVTVTWQIAVNDFIPITAEELQWVVETDSIERASVLIASTGGADKINYRQLGEIDD